MKAAIVACGVGVASRGDDTNTSTLLKELEEPWDYRVGRSERFTVVIEGDIAVKSYQADWVVIAVGKAQELGGIESEADVVE